MRRLLSITLVVLAVVLSALKVAEWTSENWWMSSLGFGPVQSLYWKWRIEAFVPAFGLWWVVMDGNARLAWHNARWRDVSLPLLGGPRISSGRGGIPPEDRIRLDSIARHGSQVFIFLSALMCGMAAANHFDLWVLAFHPPSFQPFDSSAANTSFLVSVWPALLWAWNAFGLLILFTLGLIVAIAAFEGVLDFDAHGFRVGDATARHLAFCGALLLVWVGVRCGLAALGSSINFGWSPNGITGYYDQTFANPARSFFLLSSPFLALWFARTVARQPLRPLVIAFLWSMSALFLPLIAPSFGRAVRSPSESLNAVLKAEQARHIEVTRHAWGLDRVEVRSLNVASSDFLTPATTSASPALSDPKTAPPMVVWPQEALRRALARNDTDSDRHASEVYFTRQNGQLKAQIIVSNPSRTDVTSSLALESNPALAGPVTAKRRPFQAMVMQSPLANHIPTDGSPNPSPMTGEEIAPPIARVRELESEEGVARTNVAMGLALALRFGDSSLIEAGKPLTWHLDPLERVKTLAPFVWWTGARPHPVWVPVEGDKEERLFWLVEGCFASRSFPGAAMATLPSGDGWNGLNYARQSVLGVCDASTGETQFFLFDPNEPFSRAWNELLPGFFRPASELPAELRAGTRLSPALLNAQCSLWARYHPASPGVDEVLQWAERADEWRVLESDTSVRDSFTQQVLVERSGEVGLELLAAFAPATGTVIGNPTPAPQNSGAPEARPLMAMLSARDEGDEIWKAAGRPSFSAWRRPKESPLSIPISYEGVQISYARPFTPELFDKTALLPLLDARGDCVGLQVSRGTAKQQKLKNGAAQWNLTTKLVSTKVQLLSSPSALKADANLTELRKLWNAWKVARANGQWVRVEELERELNRFLGS